MPLDQSCPSNCSLRCHFFLRIALNFHFFCSNETSCVTSDSDTLKQRLSMALAS